MFPDLTRAPEIVCKQETKKETTGAGRLHYWSLPNKKKSEPPMFESNRSNHAFLIIIGIIASAPFSAPGERSGESPHSVPDTEDIS
jgi:hypothetical protein